MLDTKSKGKKRNFSLLYKPPFETSIKSLIYRLKEDQYQFKNVESRGSGSGGETSLTDLKKFTKYSIVVQAYNALGPGPTSSEVLSVTLEDVPSAAPQDIRCAAFSSQSLQVSWSPVPDTQLHGHLKGKPGFQNGVG